MISDSLDAHVSLCVIANAPLKPGGTHDYFLDEQVALWGEDNFWCLPP